MQFVSALNSRGRCELFREFTALTNDLFAL
jgi:hypothetical protein